MISENISILHVVNSLRPADGGPSKTVNQLLDALVQHQNIKSTLLTQSKKNELIELPENSRVICDVKSVSSLDFILGRSIRNELHNYQNTKKIDLIHGHGIWLPANHWTSRFSSANNIPLVLHPRGMLQPWAMSHKAWKKKIAMILYQRSDLELVKMFIASALGEYEALRNLGFRQPIAIIPNGIDLKKSVQCLKNIDRLNDKKRSALFLSRISRSKGIINLIDAWSIAMPKGWELLIAGPDEDGHLAEVLKRIEKLGLKNSIKYIGEVTGEIKNKTYEKANIFILPTFSENFGLVVLEALMSGLPVITTIGAPWSDLEKYKCGWWIDVGIEPLVSALIDATTLTDEDRNQMGKRGRDYAQMYDWNSISFKMLQSYQWLLNRGEKPDFIQLR